MAQTVPFENGKNIHSFSILFARSFFLVLFLKVCSLILFHISSVLIKFNYIDSRLFLYSIFYFIVILCGTCFIRIKMATISSDNSLFRNIRLDLSFRVRSFLFLHTLYIYVYACTYNCLYKLTT